GVHTYTVTVTDDLGCTNTAQTTVTVNAGPIATASAATNACGNEAIILNGTGVAGGAPVVAYAWSGPAGFSSIQEDPVINPGDAAYPGPGTHTYTFTATDDNGCTATDDVVITINATPTVAAAANAVCQDIAIDLQATGTPGGAAITGYAWSGPFGFTSTTEDPTINPGTGTYPGPGLHTYTVTVTDANGCTGTDQVTVEVYTNSTVVASSTSPICTDTDIVLNATGTDGSAAITGYAWSGPAGFTSSIEDPVITSGGANYPGAGTHTYTVTVTDANGCTGTDNVEITIYGTPSVTASTTSDICSDGPINLNATGVAGGGAISGYAWSGPFGFSSNLEDPVINPGDAAYP
ncbi:MAG: hypothetical protein R3330_19215, partial [Saprospiraceae bacterium]|nr:hypothetical protein [Saprospiraceae bacterium]